MAGFRRSDLLTLGFEGLCRSPASTWGGARQYVVAWKVTEDEPREVERRMIAAFVAANGRRPFSNLKDNARSRVLISPVARHLDRPTTLTTSQGVAMVSGMDDDAVDLRLGPAIQVAAREFSVRVDGVEPEQAEAVRRRVIDTLERRWNTRADAPGPPPPQRDAPAAHGSIRVGLVGPSTNPTRHRELQDAVRAAVAGELGSDRAAAATCICFSGVPGDRINMTAGDIGWFVNGVWTPPPGGGSSWTIAVALDSAPFNWARLILRDGATFNPPVPKNQALVGLANETDWAKEIWVENLCSGRIGSVFQEGTNGTPRRMLLDRADCREGTDTIVFRKPGFWGIWHDVGHFPPELFWQAFGGTWGDYTWVID